MKRKLLQLSFLVLIFAMAGLFVAFAYTGNQQPGSSKNAKTDFERATEYLQQMRNNQITGEINPFDVLNARQQAEKMYFKSGKAFDLDWLELGPDNAPGRVRALIFDNRDETAKTLIAAGITGGLWKTTNLGATWKKINVVNQNLYVSSLAQSADGTIYVGTGEYFCTTNETYFGGLVGTGIYKSTNSDEFTLIEETKPSITALTDTVDWAYINKLVVSKNSGRIFAATNTGLWYSDNGDSWTKVTQYYHDTLTYNVTISIDSTVKCDSFIVEGNNIIMNNPQMNKAVVDTVSYEKTKQTPIRTVMSFAKINCTDVEVGGDGTVAATFGDMVFTANSNDLIFTNRSGTPSNPNLITREDRDYTTRLIAVDTLNNTADRTVTFNQITNFVADPALGRPSPLSNNPSRANVAFAPNDPSGDILYAVSTMAGYLYNVYLSEDKGETWRTIFPGGSNTLKPFNGTACYNNTFEVFPDDNYKVLLGGQTMWMGTQVGNGGFFDWGLGPITASLPSGHHVYAFQPGTNNKLVVATNLGIYYGTLGVAYNQFTEISRNLTITQCYTVATGGLKRKVLTGTQGDGTWYISGLGNTPQYGEKIDGGHGGSCVISIINPNAFIFSSSTGTIQRSDDEGQNASMNFSAPSTTLFITPIAFWEDFKSENSRDSITFKARQDYKAGDVILCRSKNPGFGLDAGYPFDYVLETDLAEGDSIRIKDIIQSKLFVANQNTVYLTKDGVKFGKESEWWQIASLVTANGQPTAIAYSKDANYLFIGTKAGFIYRISNIAHAYDYERADIRSPYCIISTDVIQIPEFENRFITSISVDPNNSNNIIVTLGNYGNEGYVYRSTNALASPWTGITFVDITGNMPKMPVYSSLIEMKDSNKAIIGTEYGIYTTDEIGKADVTWTAENQGIGLIPVFQIKQQKIYKDEYVVPSEDPSQPPLVYPRVDNYGSIYIATFGRGTYRADRFMVGIDDIIPTSNKNIETLNIYPNPVDRNTTLSFNLNRNSNIQISIYNLSGLLVNTLNAGTYYAGFNSVTLDCSRLTSGAYLIKIDAENEIMTAKMIVR